MEREQLRDDPPKTQRWGSKTHDGYHEFYNNLDAETIPINLTTLSDIDYLVWNKYPKLYNNITKKNFRKKYQDEQVKRGIEKTLSGARRASEGILKQNSEKKRKVEIPVLRVPSLPVEDENPSPASFATATSSLADFKPSSNQVRFDTNIQETEYSEDDDSITIAEEEDSMQSPPTSPSDYASLTRNFDNMKVSKPSSKPKHPPYEYESIKMIKRLYNMETSEGTFYHIDINLNSGNLPAEDVDYMLTDCGRFIRLLIKVPLELSDASYLRRARNVDVENYMTQACQLQIIHDRKKQGLREDDTERETREEYIPLPWEADPHYDENARYQSFTNRRIADTNFTRHQIMNDASLNDDEKIDAIVELALSKTENLQLTFKKKELKSRRKKLSIGNKESF